jgi:hypothetical protein
MDYDTIQTACEQQGLNCRGGFDLEDDDYEQFPQLPRSTKTLIMIGNTGSTLWSVVGEHLSCSTAQNPLDDWTRSQLDRLASQVCAQVIYPFDGPPYAPFQQWAMRSESVTPSPIGPLIHPDYGLWHAYRAAFIFDEVIELPEQEEAARPCDTCLDRPCLSACPANALGMGRYDVPACVAQLETPNNQCMAHSCLARLACPVGRDFVYGVAMGQFHMNKFLEVFGPTEGSAAHRIAGDR